MQTNTEECRYIGDLLKADTLLEKYKDTPFHSSIASLARSDSNIRPIRRDGNCFYYSIIFLALEYYSTPALSAALINTLTELNGALAETGVEDYLIKEFTDPIMTILKSATTGEAPNIEDLDSIFWNYTVTYFRMIASAYIKKNSEVFAGFIEGPVDKYCAMNIEASSQYAGEIEITAISSSLSISFDVVCIEDGKMETLTRGEGPKIGSLLYISEHFDILYS
ncbi:ubiquitin thioesterase protein OTUB1 [Nematocida minor]|uniref:ubiquitin thioesterase protein OTUB1 n=1 Tax=Nematocida minor TaxID=1912983 RepID=UPI002220ABCD|nr:ubiquitin thioesterase protein OTUB1 [Nematocida minor]KAI5190075.1 ubiquitin thioesterase protein OTUB1 [Nematocida minor]